MTGKTQVGRPRGRLAQPSHILTERVRRLIDAVHAGKVRDASRLTGIPYPTLNDLYVGRTVNPNLATLERLITPYRVDLAWLLSDSDPSVEPQTGRMIYLPPDQKAATKRRTLREVEIPFVAWSMYDVFATLEMRLAAMPQDAARPIVADAAGDAMLFRLATFLFQPLLAAEKAGEGGVIQDLSAGNRMNEEDTRRWAAQLEALGRMWTLVVPGLLAGGKPDASLVAES